MRKSESVISPGRKSVDFHADVKAHTAPLIRKIKNIHGVPTYILVNGNTQSVESYNKMWRRPRMEVKPKGTKSQFDPLLKLQKL